MRPLPKHKILFVSSAGGHFSELMCLEETMLLFDSILVTEHSDSSKANVNYFLKPAVRTHYFSFLLAFVINFLHAFLILFKERPCLIISTGSHACIPFFILSRLFSIKTIYVESFARVNTFSFTCRALKKLSDRVIVQHSELHNVDNNVLFFGQIF